MNFAKELEMAADVASHTADAERLLSKASSKIFAEFRSSVGSERQSFEISRLTDGVNDKNVPYAPTGISRPFIVNRGSAETVSQLSNASLDAVRLTGLTKFNFSAPSVVNYVADFKGSNFSNIERNFDQFVELFRDANALSNSRKRLQESIEAYDEQVLPALRDSGIQLLHTRKYENSSLLVRQNLDLAKTFELSSGDRVDLGTDAGFQKFLSQEQQGDLRGHLDEMFYGKSFELPARTDWKEQLALAAVVKPELRTLLNSTRVVDGEVLPSVRFVMSLPLKPGLQRYLNTNYHAHARFEETMHLMQFANGAPLTKLGSKLEESIFAGDPALMGVLQKDWSTDFKKGRFVRENDMTAIYRETGINPPGLFYWMYDRRPVTDYIGMRR